MLAWCFVPCALYQALHVLLCKQCGIYQVCPSFVIDSLIVLKLILRISIAILLAAPHITAAPGNSQLSSMIKGMIVLVAAIASVRAGFIATFGLDRNFLANHIRQGH